MTTTVIPSVAIQEVYSGGQFTGVAPDGDWSEEESFRGRLQKWIGGAVGGDFPAPAAVGMRVDHVWWNMACTVAPNVAIYLVDDDDTEYLLDTQNVVSGNHTETSHGFLVPPTFSVRVKADQVIDAVLPIAGENTGVAGDGVSNDYDITLVNGRVDPTSVSIVAGAVTFTDPAGLGILVGAGAGGGSGTINYLTGVVELTLVTPGDWAAGNATAAYDYNQIGRVGIVIRQGWGQPAPSSVGMIGVENTPPSMQRT